MASDPGRGPAPRGRPRAAEVDAAILDTALALFVEGGLPAVSFDQIARRSGVSRTSIYRRWRSRDEVVAAALQRIRATGEEGLENWAELPVHRVVAGFEERAATTLSTPAAVALLRQIAALDDADGRLKQIYWSTIVRPRRDVFAQMIVAARRSGELPDGADPELLQDLLAGALLYRALVHPDRLDEAGARSYVRALVEELGLSGPAGD